MQGFDRITFDPQIMAGLPCIRDTGIPVYRVLNLIAEKTRFADILAQYPALEMADIEQAVQYGVQEMAQTVRAVHFDLKAPLTSVLGYSDLLLKEAAGQLNERQREFVEIILRKLEGMRLELLLLSLWASGYYALQRIQQRGRASLAEIAQNARIRLHHYEPFDIDIPADLPSIQCASFLLTNVICYLIWLSRFAVSHTEPEEMKPRIAARQLDREIEVRIIIHWKPDSRFIANPIERLMAAFPPFTVAGIFIHEHGGNLTVHATEDHVEFRFTLPVWRDDDAPES